MSINPAIFKAYDVRGLYPQEINEDAARLIGRGFVSYLGAKRMIGLRGYEPWALRKSLDLLVAAKDKYPWDDLLSHTIPFEEITAAFQLSAEHKVRRAAIAINPS